MLKADQKFELYPEWRDCIENHATRAAFCYLVGIAAASRRFDCDIRWKGAVRNFRFTSVASDSRPYSFITNKTWLLFYFREVDAASPTLKAQLSRLFDSFNETPAGEWTVKLRAIEDVDRLLQLIDLQ